MGNDNLQVLETLDLVINNCLDEIRYVFSTPSLSSEKVTVFVCSFERMRRHIKLTDNIKYVKEAYSYVKYSQGVNVFEILSDELEEIELYLINILTTYYERGVQPSIFFL